MQGPDYLAPARLPLIVRVSWWPRFLARLVAAYFQLFRHGFGLGEGGETLWNIHANPLPFLALVAVLMGTYAWCLLAVLFLLANRFRVPYAVPIQLALLALTAIAGDFLASGWE